LNRATKSHRHRRAISIGREEITDFPTTRRSLRQFSSACINDASLFFFFFFSPVNNPRRLIRRDGLDSTRFDVQRYPRFVAAHPFFPFVDSERIGRGQPAATRRARIPFFAQLSSGMSGRGRSFVRRSCNRVLSIPFLTANVLSPLINARMYTE